MEAPAKRLTDVSAQGDEPPAKCARTGIAKLSEITLTDQEKEVFKILLEVVQHFELGSTVRAAGGWVRDKLLGLASDDVDICVDNMSGEDFAQKVSEYMSLSAMEGCSRIGVVKQNPDQSKHLATACFNVCGLSLDVNHLRTETYTEDSRIPQVSIGTAEEDAYRRDFTCNALFYNISEAKVEDLVGTGLNDLREGLIRTPLSPRQTFRDDPLRILRAVRFASRLSFKIDTEILSAAKESEMHQLLATKVSRERIGIELDKTMKSLCPGPLRTLEMIEQANLWEPILMSPELRNALVMGTEIKMEEIAKEGVRRARAALGFLGTSSSREDNRLAAYASLLSPWRGECIVEKKKSKPLIYGVLRIALKLPGDISEQSPLFVDAACALLEARNLSDSDKRLKFGKQLRICKEKWPVALALSEALGPTDSFEDAERSFHAARKWVHESGIDGCWDWKPFVDGKQLMQPPFSVPKGKRVGELYEMQNFWRLENPQLDEATCRSRLLELLNG